MCFSPIIESRRGSVTSARFLLFLAIVIPYCSYQYIFCRKLIHFFFFRMNININATRRLCLELRTYALKPSHFGKYIQLSNEKFHLRTAHSKLNGFWIHDLGGLNAVTHLWEYQDLADRAQVRANLGQFLRVVPSADKEMKP